MPLPSDATLNLITSEGGVTSGTINGATFSLGTFGSGTYTPFLSIQDSPTERGYNTDGNTEFDTINSSATHALTLSEIPIITINGVAYFEFRLDVNEGTAANGYLSIDTLKIYQATDNDLTGYNVGNGTFSNGSSTLVYDLDAGGDKWVAYLNGTAGSGSGDIVLRVPVSNFNLTDPDTYVYLFNANGSQTPDSTYGWSSSGGAETWSVLEQPVFPTISINDVTVNEDAGTATFTVSLSHVSTSSAVVQYVTANGSAVAGQDYTAVATSTLNFGPGEISKTVTINILNDAVNESTETFFVNLSNPTNATIADGQGVATILDDNDDIPTLSVSSPTVTEGNNAFAQFTISLSNTSDAPVTVSLSLSNGTAQGAGVDYGAVGATNIQVSTNGGANWTNATSVTIAAGSSSVLVRTPINNDALDEANETFTLTATRTAGSTTNTSASGTATIQDNDPQPSFSINDVSVNENAGTATFTVTLSEASGRNTSVNYATANSTATSGSDYTTISSTVLNFAAGVTSQTITVSILNDSPAVYEGSEAFFVNLSGATNATIDDAQGVGTILDNEDIPTIAVSSPTVAESAGFAQFTVSLSNASTTAVTVSLSLANVTAQGTGTDYGAAGATNIQVSTDGGSNWVNATSATFAAGTTSLLVRTPINNDVLDEANETFTLTATKTAGTTTNTSAVGTATITDNDPTPSFSINDVSVNENAGTATFTVTLSAASGQATSVNYVTANNTAASGTDYTAVSSTALNFAAGVTSQTITISILNDSPAVYEGSETFFINLSGATNATIADAQGIGTIVDNEDIPTIAVSSPTVAENAGFAQFTLSLSNASTTPISVNLSLANVTAQGAGVDYGAAGATNIQVSTDGGSNWTNATSATFAAGTTSILVRTPVNNDALDEANETFTLTATKTSGTTSNTTASGTATITDDDATPSFSINDVSVNENAGTATFTVTLSAASGQSTSVNYVTANNTAASGTDYTAISSIPLNFAAGVTSQTITVSILNDTPAVYEGSETFFINLSGATNATIADAQGIGTIVDNEDIPTIAVSSPTVAENAGFAQFTVSLSNASATPVTVSLGLANATAQGGGTDYGAAGATNIQVSTDGGSNWTNATSATIAAGATSILVRTPVNNDALDETNETFTLTATKTAGTTTNTSASGTATITDDDATPSFSINDVSVNENAGTATFTVTLSAASGQSTSVNYVTANNTATSGSDYTAISSTALNFAAGVTSQTITVSILNDTPAVYEGSETFFINLSGATNATIADAQGIGTIVDNEDIPTIAVTSPTVAENAGFAQFTVSLSNASTTPVTVSLSLANVTAQGAGTDYGAAGATNIQVSTDGGSNWVNATSATFAAGTTSILVRTPVNNDALDEANETFTLTATKTAGTTTNTSVSGTATITDDDATPSFSINDVSVNENAGTATFTVTLSAASGQSTSVNYVTANSTATSGTDYTAISSTPLNFAAGVTSQTITVSILNDTPAVYEGSETFFINLSGATNATIADAQGIGTIVDNEDIPTIAVTSPTVAENAGFAQFTVSLSNASTTPISVDLSLANVTAQGGGTDYGAAGPTNIQVSTDGGSNWVNATSATFAAGTTSILVRTPVNNDALDEANETFTLTATKTAGTTTNTSVSGTATITDDDATPSFSINDVTVNEADGTATFTVTLSAPSGQITSVNYATANNSAAAGSDYTSVASTPLTFAAGVTSQTITVSILNDTPAVYEGSETFFINLSGATNATISDAQGIGTIVDNEDIPTIAVTSPTVAENAGFAQFTVSLSNASTTPISVDLSLANVTAQGSGTDYGAAGATNVQVSTDGGSNWVNATSATFAAGATSILVRTPVNNDALDEANETFTLTATKTAGTTTNTSVSGTATITDDDATPSFSINDVTVNEADGTATFTVTLSAPSGQITSVNYATANNSASAGSDYTSVASTPLTFAAGVTSQTVTITILNDSPGVYEGSENFFVNLFGATNATIADAQGIGTITDNDDTPTLAVSSPTVTEGTNSFAVFIVSLSNASHEDVSFDLSLSNGSAIGNGIDYGSLALNNLQISTDQGANWVNATNATIAAGQTEVWVRTAINNDALDEAAESFTLTATKTAGETTNSSAIGTATITDDDATPSFSINDVIVNEADGTATFTVTLSAPSGQITSVNYATANNSASAGSDYTSVASTPLTFAAGVTSQTVTITILNDSPGVYEGSENFFVNLFGATNATIADTQGVGTIADNGDIPTLAVSSPTVTEGTDSFAVFIVSLSNASYEDISLDLSLSNGSAIGNGTDYGSLALDNLQISTDQGANWINATSATIDAGQTEVWVRTPINNDALDEAAENFTLTATKTAGETTNSSAIGTATITDNDATPSFSINDVIVNEADGTATFTVTLSAPSGQITSVNYATANNSAAAGSDYTSVASTPLTFAAGVTSQTVTINILNDNPAVYEGSENFFVNLFGATNATIADAQGIGTITDNDDIPTLDISSPTVTEGTDGFALFIVSLSNASHEDVSFDLSLSNGSATGNGTDYGSLALDNLQISTDQGANWVNATNATITAGQTEVWVRTPINNDALDEAAENFTLTATKTAGDTTNNSATGTASITDDDATPSFSINDVIVNEADGTATFTVTLSAPSGQITSVNYTTANNSAAAGSDYTSIASTPLTFAAGVTSQTVTINILNDNPAVYEGSENFFVNLFGATNATIADAQGAGTIADNDDIPTLAVSNSTVTEGTDGFAVFIVSLSNASYEDIAFDLSLSNGSAIGNGTDYGSLALNNLQISTNQGANWANATSATIIAGQTEVWVRTPINNDALDEVAENFTLTATKTAGETTNSSAIGTATITDNDATPSFSINDVIVNEADGTATFTVTLSAASGQITSVNYATADNSATAGSDYTSVANTLLTFAPGVTSQTVTITILNDSPGVYEGSENFFANLFGAINATITDAQGVGTIADNGDIPTLAVSSPTVTEGSDGFALFIVSLSNASYEDINFDLSLSNGSATGNGTDYGSLALDNLQISTDQGANWINATSATIATGQTEIWVRTPINNDALDEALENFTLTATKTAGETTNSSAIGTATITDNDATPSFSINDVIVNEADGTATFTVTLSAPSGQITSVNYATANNSAAAGSDYTSVSSTPLTFAAGVTSQTVTVNILNDNPSVYEGSENFFVNLFGATNATIADAQGVGTIADNDDMPTLAVSSPTVTEDTDGFAVFIVSLSNASYEDVSFDLSLSNGSATGNGTDYGSLAPDNLQISTDQGANWINATSATIDAGQTEVWVRTPINNDALDEALENFTLTATKTSGETTNNAATGTATITDDDATPSFSINDVIVNEADGTATFTVTLSAPSGQTTSVNYATANNSASAGSDYTSASSTPLTFAAGVTSQTVTINILDDNPAVYEGSENFFVNLFGATNATIADAQGVGTIADNDDVPTLAVNSPTITEGTDGFVVFIVSLSNASYEDVSFDLSLSDGSAVDNAIDYGSLTPDNLQISTDQGVNWVDATSATIAAGLTEVWVRTPLINDTLDEALENFTLIATKTTGNTVNDVATGTATITDNDATPSFSINNVIVNEADGTATFTVTLSAASGQVTSVNYATANNSAAAGSDYTSVTSTPLTFAPGVTSQTVTINILNDNPAVYEGSENFFVNLFGATNATIADSQGIGTILDDGSNGIDNDVPTLAVSNPNVVEGLNGFAVFIVSLNNPSYEDISFNLSLADGSATGNGADYGSLAADNLQISTDQGANWVDATSATIDAGQTEIWVRTPISDDASDEVSETFSLIATKTTGTTTNTIATGTATIIDDDATPSLFINNITVNEATASGFAVFIVGLSNASDQDVSVDLSLSDGSAAGNGTDYGSLNPNNLQISTDQGANWINATSATIVAGQTEVWVRTPINNDALDEAAENFTLTATKTAGDTSNNTVTGTATIIDNDATPSFSINNVIVNEADGTATFTVTLSAASGQMTSVNYATANNSATGGSDYTSVASTQLTFAAGVTSQTVTINILNDNPAIYEGSENFFVNLFGATNATIADSQGVGTILDDGSNGADNDIPTLAVTNPTVTEGTDGFAIFIVSLSNASHEDVSFDLSLSNGSATGNGTDYGSLALNNLQISTNEGVNWVSATNATIAAGQTEIWVRTPINNDALDEAAENFTLTATKTAGETTNNSATGTAIITDNDATPSFSINDVIVNEADGTATFTVTLSAPSGQITSVNYATANNSAAAGSDYTSASSTPLTFAAGVTSQTVTINILNDNPAVYEGSENFFISLFGATNATIADAQGIGTITDNDDIPTLDISSPTVTEGTDGFALFIVSLSNASHEDVSFDLSLSNGSATGNGTDYGSLALDNLQISTDQGANWVNATNATITAGQTEVWVRTPINNDALDEAAENFTLTATKTAGDTTNNSATGTAAITDDDATPSFSINDVIVNEADGTATFTITLSAPSGQMTSVNYATANNSAAAGSDYTSIASTPLTFAAGVTSQTVTINILNDNPAVYEGSENFFVNLFGANNATIADAQGVGTIADNDDIPTLDINNPTVTEGTDGFATFIISLSNASYEDVSFDLSLSNGSAIGSGTDYGSLALDNLQVSTDQGANWVNATNATITAGQTEVWVRTPINNDALDEAAENFTLTATKTAGETTNSSVAGTASISDDDATPSFSINDVIVNEADGTATFTVTLSAPSGQITSVNYATANNSAAAGSDYTSVSSTPLTFAAGVISQTVTVNILNDNPSVYEGSENFFVNLFGATNATIADAQGMGTIADNDDMPTLAVSSPTVTEGTDSFAVFIVSLSNASHEDVSFDLSLSNGSATGNGTDYGSLAPDNLQISTDQGANWVDATSATIATGQTEVWVRTPINNDALDEAAENFTLTVTKTAGETTNNNATGTATITDDDATPSFSINDVIVNEADGTATFTVTLSAPSGQITSVNYTTANNSAAAGSDYTSVASTPLTFAAGVTSQTVTINILNDNPAVYEGSENFFVNLFGATNATIADAQGVGTIADNDDTPTLAVSSPNVIEGMDGFATFIISLSNASYEDISFDLSLSNGSATGNGTDYGSLALDNLQISTDQGANWINATSATIAAGQTEVWVRTPINNDALDEAAENFTLTATKTAGETTNNTATGTATITDDDATPSFSINDVIVNEADGTATFTITLSAPSGQMTSVNYATANNSAAAGSDYTSIASTPLTFAAGVTSQTVTINILNDNPAVYEGSENFFVNLFGATNATIADAQGVGTIADNDDIPTLAVSSPTATEGMDGFAVFIVSLSNASHEDVSFGLSLSNGSAIGNGTDYGSLNPDNLQVSTDQGATWVNATNATIAAGQTEAWVRTPIGNDTLNEAAESFTLTVTKTAGDTTNNAATGTATITDDDATPSFSINDVIVNEADGTATFTVTLSAPSGQITSVNYATANNSASAGSDYTSASSTPLTFAAGVTSQTVTINILNDNPAVYEGSENFFVNLFGAINATIADAQGVGTILDDGSNGSDNDIPTFAISSPTVVEGMGGFAVFVISLSNASNENVSFDLTLSDGSATDNGTDYGSLALDNLQVSTDGGTVWTNATSATIAAGVTSILVRTPVNNDALNEINETFALTATKTSGTTTNIIATGTATINDDDAQPSFSVNDIVVNEAAGTATFTVTLSAASGQITSVNYATADNSASAGSDYTSVASTLLTFAPGVTSQTVTIAILNDNPAIYEDAENFFVNLFGATNATIDDSQGVGTIVDAGTNGPDNDIPTLNISSSTVTEGLDLFALFIVSLSNASHENISFDLSLLSGSATGNGTDYGSVALDNLQISTDQGANWVNATSATIAAGSTEIWARTAINDDTINENSESFSLNAQVTEGTTTNQTQSGTVTILDNDLPPSFSIGDVTVNEAAGFARFTISLSHASGIPTSVHYATQDNTAQAGLQDYIPFSGTVSFTPGQLSQDVLITIDNDNLFELSENFFINLTAANGATIGDAQAEITILDDGSGDDGTDNDTPVLSINNTSALEGSDSFATFTLNLSNPSAFATTVSLSLTDGSAAGSGQDYGSLGANNIQVSTDNVNWTNSSNITFNPGVTELFIRTPITDDNVQEAAENFTFIATVTSGNTFNQSVTGNATINDNDSLGPDFTIVKTSDVQNVNAAGDVIHYTVVITNTGSVNLTGASLLDQYEGSTLTTFTPNQSQENDTDGILQVGQTWTFTYTHTVTASEIATLGDGDGLGNTFIADFEETNPQAATSKVNVANTNNSLDLVIGAKIDPVMSVSFVDKILPWYSAFATMNVATLTVLSITTDFNIDTNRQYAIALEHVNGLPTEITTFVAEYTPIVLVNNTTLHAIGYDVNASSWQNDAQTATGSQMMGDSLYKQALTAEITPGTSITSHGDVTHAAAFSTDGNNLANTLTDASPGTYNYLYGDAGKDVITGSSGMDIINGGGGRDILNGMGGNDIMVYDPVDARIDGGLGLDILRLEAGTDIALSAINNLVTSNTGVILSSIEVLDLSGYTMSGVFNAAFAGGANSLVMSADAIKNLSGLVWGDLENSDPTLAQKIENLATQDSAAPIQDTAKVLFVNGDANDSVSLTDGNSSWNHIGVASVLGSQGYNAYIHTGADNTQTIALIDSHINNVSIAA